MSAPSKIVCDVPSGNESGMRAAPSKPSTSSGPVRPKTWQLAP